MDWLSPDLDALIRDTLAAEPYAGNMVDLVHFEFERAQRRVLAGAPALEASGSLARAGAAAAAAGLAGRLAADPGVDGDVRLVLPDADGKGPVAAPSGDRVWPLATG